MAAHMIGVWGVVNRQVNAIRRERVFRDRLNPLDIFDDTELYSRFRFDREGIMMIIDLLDAELSHLTQQNHALPTSLQVFITLRYYASGSFQSVTGDTICVSNSVWNRSKFSKSIIGPSKRPMTD